LGYGLSLKDSRYLFKEVRDINLRADDESINPLPLLKNLFLGRIFEVFFQDLAGVPVDEEVVIAVVDREVDRVL